MLHIFSLDWNTWKWHRLSIQFKKSKSPSTIHVSDKVQLSNMKTQCMCLYCIYICRKESFYFYFWPKFLHLIMLHVSTHDFHNCQVLVTEPNTVTTALIRTQWNVLCSHIWPKTLQFSALFSPVTNLRLRKTRRGLFKQGFFGFRSVKGAP